MFTLELERNKFYRMKKGQSAAEAEKVFSCPFAADLRCGSIVPLSLQPLKIYTVRVGDDYKKIASAFCVDVERLKELNGNKTLYPTRAVFLPAEG